ncbi:MAG: S8 family serine peptidase [Pseudomonadota bacterium]|nr:MAG: S8 family serine peptidase [Pseudomonadota bacterium]
MRPSHLITGLVLAALSSSAESSPAERYLLHRAPDDGDRLLELTTRIEHYGAFQVVELSIEQARELSASGGSLQDLRTHRLRLGSGWSWDTRGIEPAIPPELSTPWGRPGLYLVQLRGPVRRADLEEIESLGARRLLSAYFPNFGFLFWFNDAATLDTATSLSFVQWIGVYQPAYKMVAEKKERPPRKGRYRLRVKIVDSERLPSVLAGLNALGLDVGATIPAHHYLDTPTIELEIPADRLPDLLSLPEVWWVEQIVPPVLLSETAREIHQAGVGNGCSGSLAEVPVWADGITAAGPAPRSDATPGSEQLVGVLDTTFNSPDFSCSSGIPNDTIFKYVDGSSCDISNTVTSCVAGHAHGSGSAGVILGNGAQSGGETPTEACAIKGGAFGARLWALRCDSSPGSLDCLNSCSSVTTLADFFQASYADGSRISNHSWGTPVGGSYTTDSEQLDIWAYDNDNTTGNGLVQEYLWITSAGNTGSGASSIYSPSTAKNDISAAAFYNGVDGSCWPGDSAPCDASKIVIYSSRGPTSDGRHGPDVAGASHYVQTPNDTSGYQNFPGTSSSAPSLTALVALIRDWLQNVHGLPAPSGSLMKALLLNSGEYLPHSFPTSGEDLPGTAQGWGRPNLQRICNDWTNPWCSTVRSVWTEGAFGGTGESNAIPISVDSSGAGLRCLLAWMDPPNLAGGGALINDLNLRVTSPADVVYLGNDFSGAWSNSAGIAFDNRNNTEGIRVQSPETGIWTVEVLAGNVAIEDQPWSLVCSGNVALTSGYFLNAEPDELAACASTDALYTVQVDSLFGYAEPVALSLSGHPGVEGFSVNPVTPSSSSTLTISGLSAGDAGPHTLTVSGEGNDPENPGNPILRTDDVALTVYAGQPGGAILDQPANGATDVAFSPTYHWSAATEAAEYLVEVAEDSAFNVLVDSATVTTTSYHGIPLAGGGDYWWRVTPSNTCGEGITSSVFSFTVQTSTLVCNGAPVTFEDGIPLDWTVVDHTGGDGVVWATTASSNCGIPNNTNGSGEAACADSDAAGSGAPPFDTELVSPPFDLEASTGRATLKTAAYYRDLNIGSNDRFEVDIWNGASWNNLLTWDESHQPGDLSLELSSYAGTSGLKLRFRYSGNGFDWYAQVDDVTLTCLRTGVFEDRFESGEEKPGHREFTQ